MQPLPDETTITEISIAPDGRLYVFGASAEVLEALAAVEQRDSQLQQRVAHLRRGKVACPAVETRIPEVEIPPAPSRSS